VREIKGELEGYVEKEGYCIGVMIIR